MGNKFDYSGKNFLSQKIFLIGYLKFNNLNKI